MGDTAPARPLTPAGTGAHAGWASGYGAVCILGFVTSGGAATPEFLVGRLPRSHVVAVAGNAGFRVDIVFYRENIEFELGVNNGAPDRPEFPQPEVPARRRDRQ